MIGDNPIVVVVVTLAIVAFLYMKLSRRADPRLCPQCQRHVMALKAASDAFACPHCGSELRRASDGTLHRR